MKSNEEKVSRMGIPCERALAGLKSASSSTTQAPIVAIGSERKAMAIRERIMTDIKDGGGMIDSIGSTSEVIT